MTSNTGLKVMVLVKGEYLKMVYFYVQLQITILVLSPAYYVVLTSRPSAIAQSLLVYGPLQTGISIQWKAKNYNQHKQKSVYDKTFDVITDLDLETITLDH